MGPLPSPDGRAPADRLHRPRVDPAFPPATQTPGRRPERGGDRPRRHRVRPARAPSARTSAPRIWTALAAEGGLRYNRFHVTSLCSPTRASLPHRAATTTPSAWASSPTSPWPSPGTLPACPTTAATLPRLLRDAGYRTLAVGKWHLVPRWERSAAGPFDRWPLGLGFERYYGFLQGDTNHWTPNLVCDNHYVEPPRRPEDGYHLTEDLADTAIRYGARPAAGRAGQAVLPLLRPSAPCTRRTTSPPSGSSRTGAASTRAGTRGATSCSPARSRRGSCPQGTVLTARPSWVRRVGRPQRRRAADARAAAGGVRRLPHPHRRPDRAAPRPLSSGSGVLDDTIVMVLLRQRCQRRGRAARHAQRAPLHGARPRDGRRDNLEPLRRLGRLPHLHPLLVGLGVGGQHAAAAVEALHVAGRDAHPADRPLARPHVAAPGAVAPAVRARRRPDADDPRRARRQPARRGRRRRPAARRRRQSPVDVRRPGGARAHRDAVLRDARLAVDLPRGLEGDDRPRIGRASLDEEELMPTAAATSTTTSGRCSTSRPTSPRRPTRRPTIPTSCGASSRAVAAEAGATRSCPSTTAAWTASAPSSRRHGRPRPSDVRARRRPGDRRVRPAAVGRVPHHG